MEGYIHDVNFYEQGKMTLTKGEAEADKSVNILGINRL